MSVGRITDTCLPKVAKILLVLLDFRVPSGEVQCDFRHVMHIAVADVPHRDTGVRVAFLDLHEAFRGTQVWRRRHADIFGADLFEKEQLLVCWFGGRLCAKLDPGLPP